MGDQIKVTMPCFPQVFSSLLFTNCHCDGIDLLTLVWKLETSAPFMAVE